MTKNAKYFLASLLFSLPLWWGINEASFKVEDFLFWNAMSKDAKMLSADASYVALKEKVYEERPNLKSDRGELNLEAKAVISVFVGDNGKVENLYTKNTDEKLPIASISKLMTGLVALEEYPLDQVVPITKKIVQEEGDVGFFAVGDEFFVRDLLYTLLMESNNDAAAALASVDGRSQFISQMNVRATELGLNSTVFVNPTGLDPDRKGDGINVSTAQDLAYLAMHILREYPSLMDILAIPELNLYTSKAQFHHTMKNTDELLTENQWHTKVVGGKTGYTPKAQGCLVLVLESPKGKGYIVNVILGSDDRFGEMKKLVDWVYDAYLW